jgi:hypothetical protein
LACGYIIALDAGMTGMRGFDPALTSAKRALMLKIMSFSNPELDFDETMDGLIRLTKEFFGVDRGMMCFFR